MQQERYECYRHDWDYEKSHVEYGGEYRMRQLKNV